MALSKWVCTEKCVFANRLWKTGETTRRVVRPCQHFKRVPDTYVGEGNKQVSGEGGMAAGVQPALDIPPDHGKVEAVTVEDHEDDSLGAHGDPGVRTIKGEAEEAEDIEDAKNMGFDDPEATEGGGD